MSEGSDGPVESGRTRFHRSIMAIRALTTTCRPLTVPARPVSG